MSMVAHKSDNDWLVQHHFLNLYAANKNIVKKKSIFFMMYANFLNKPLFEVVPTAQHGWHQLCTFRM